MKTIESLDSGTLLVKEGNLEYVQFESLLKYENKLIHCFTTRVGGVSTGEYNSLNLGFKKNDAIENVRENFRRICSSLGLDVNKMVFSSQVHGNLVKKVGPENIIDFEKLKPVIENCDGIATAERGLTLVTFYADCVPVMLYEKGGKAAACVHSGWRSTLQEIVCEAVKLLKLEFGVEASALECVIGPSIGKCCFEVDNDVYELFRDKFAHKKYYNKLENNKWKIDLREIIKDSALFMGIMEENIHKSSVCTVCRRDLFFSHRGDRGKTGSLAALMHLR